MACPITPPRRARAKDDWVRAESPHRRWHARHSVDQGLQATRSAAGWLVSRSPLLWGSEGAALSMSQIAVLAIVSVLWKSWKRGEAKKERKAGPMDD